jgi:transcriptional regulator GlxA family with amidase domain
MADTRMETNGLAADKLWGVQTRHSLEHFDNSAPDFAAHDGRVQLSGTLRTVAASRRLEHARLRRVLEYISAHLPDEVTVADLARVACLSTSHFAHTFRLTVGVSPHRCISRMRLEKAMTEVAAGTLPLAQVALNAGFSSQASFTRAFHRATGVTPGNYRRHRR